MKTNVRYMLSFLLLALIVITLLAGGASVLYGDYSRRQIEDRYMASFSAAQNQSDRRLESLLQYHQQLSDSLSLYMTSDACGSYQLDEATLVAMLNNFESNAAWPVSLAFFLRSQPQRIMTSRGCVSYLDYEVLLQQEGINVDITALFSTLLTVKSPVVSRPSATAGKLLLYLPLGTAWSSYPATLLMLVDESLLSECFNRQAIGESSSLYALDSLGQLALCSPAPGMEALTSRELFDGVASGITFRQVDGEDMVFLRQPSSTELMTYIGVVPERVFYQSWYAMQRSLLTIVAIVTALAIVLSLILGQVIYLPVRRAYKRVTGQPPRADTNELAGIVDAFERTRENVSELEGRQTATSTILRRQLMLGLINSTIKTPEELATYRQGLQLNLNRRWWLSLYLACPDAAPGRTDSLLMVLEDCQLEQAELLFAECRWEKGIGLVVNFDDDDPDHAPERLAHAIYAFLCRQLAGPMLLGAGSLETDPLSMGTSFYRATATVKAAAQEIGVAVYQAEPPAPSRLSLDTALLAEGITYGNAEVAEKALQELMLRVSSCGERLPLVHLMLSDILNTVIRYAQKQRLPIDKARLCTVSEFRTLEEFHQCAGELIRDLCAASSHMRMQDSAQDRSRVITFINQNYKRNDLSLKLLSDEVSMSMSKINLVLKENLGCSFVQYVSLLRLGEVKRLLRETDDSIQSIVQSVGYIDVSSFMRKFKQMEGMAPGQYRAMHRHR